MKMQPAFSEYSAAAMLKKHSLRWWWRDIDPNPWSTFSRSKPTLRNQSRAHAGYVFNTEYSQAAYNYELAARINDKFKFEFGGDWTTLSAEQKETLRERWPTKTKPGGNASIIMQLDGPPRPAQDGWSTPRAFSFNLRRNNDALAGAFMKLVEQLRSERNIHPGRNEGSQNRGDRRNWRLIELLDVQRFKIRPLNASERSQVAKVQRTSKASI